MSYIDSDILSDPPYWYRLRTVANTGEEFLVGPVEAASGDAPPFVRLYPPMDRSTDTGIPIRYRVGGGRTQIRLEVFTATGRLLRVLDRGFVTAGEHVVIWDGNSDAGHAAARGTYFVRLATDHGSVSKKLVRLHH